MTGSARPGAVLLQRMGFQPATGWLVDATPLVRKVITGTFYFYYCSRQESPKRARTLLNNGVGLVHPESVCNGRGDGRSYRQTSQHRLISENGQHFWKCINNYTEEETSFFSFFLPHTLFCICSPALSSFIFLNNFTTFFNVRKKREPIPRNAL